MHASNGKPTRLLLALFLLGFVTHCANTPVSTEFTKVKYFHLEDPEMSFGSFSTDPMIRFEKRHFLHGAVTEAEREERLGHYYTFFWEAPPNTPPLTLRFEFQQARTGEQVHYIDVPIVKVRHRNETLLQISGRPYQENGRVVAWQASLRRGAETLDVTRSFLWNS